MNDDRFLAELRTEVLDAAERAGRPTAPRRPARLGRLAAAAAVVVAVVAGIVMTRPDTAAAGVQITRSGDDLVVRLTDLETRPEEIEEAAAEAGLDLTIVDEPVGPSLVGRFIGSSGTDAPAVLEVVEGDPASGFTGFRIPATFDGSLTLRLGRTAEEGEEWAALSDATAKGEVLECQQLVGATLAEVVAAAADKGAHVRAMLLDAGQWLEGEALAEHADAVAVRVSSPAADTVWVDVTERSEWFEPATTTTMPFSEGC